MGLKMELSRTERLLLANQFKILGLLEPDESDYYDQAKEILENGYEAHYDGLFQNIDEDTLTAEQCGEVTEILNMFRDINHGLSKLDDKSDIWMHKATFDGFDFNDEERAIGTLA